MKRPEKRVILAVATEWASAHGGLSTLNREFCRALARRGHTVYCYVEKPSAAELRDAKEHEVVLLRAAQMEAGPPKEELMLEAPLPRGVFPEIVIGHGRVTGQAAKAQTERYFPGAKRVHFLHVVPEEISPYTHTGGAAEAARERDLQERNACKGADLVIGVGPLIHREMGNLLSAFSRKPRILRIDPAFSAPDAVRELPEGLHVLVMGRLEDFLLKGVDIAVRAIAQIANDLPVPPVLVVRGAPPGAETALRKQLLNFAPGVETDLRLRVRLFTTDQQALGEDLQRASLLLMPSRAEGFGLVGVEALAAGTPVLLSNRSGLAELIREKLGPSGDRYIVNVNDAEGDATVNAWATRMRVMLMNRQEAFVDVVSAARIISEGHTWESVVDEVMANVPQSGDDFIHVDAGGIVLQQVARATMGAGPAPSARESLASAVRHPNREGARALLYALTRKRADDGETAIAQIYAFRTLAILEDRPYERLEIRRSAVRLARKSWERFRIIGTAVVWADAAVDCFYDQFSPEQPDQRDLMLREAKNVLDEALKIATEPHDRAAILSQKSSLLGCQALVSRQQDRGSRFHERLACARKAVQSAETNHNSLVALGNAEWMAARWTSDYSRRVAHLNEAEVAFRGALSDDPVSRLVLCRFWRLTYRPLRAMETFSTYIKLEHDIWRRRFESHLVGEAAVLLQFQGYATEVVKAAAQYARSFLEDAIASGVATARTYIAMANVLQLLGMSEDAHMMLGGLRRAKQGDWIAVLSEAMTALKDGRSSEVESAFALGLTEAGVWNQLGSYVRRYTTDVSFARACWETGLRMRDNDPELLTNLARSLAQSDEQADVVLASAYVDRAALIADQTRPWWRPVRKEIEEARRRLGLSPLPPLKGGDHGWAMVETSLDELRAQRIDAAMMLQRLSRFSYGIHLSQEWIETSEFTFQVEGRGSMLVLHADGVTALEIGLKQFEEVVSGRLGLAALIERDISALLRSPQSLYSDN